MKTMEKLARRFNRRYKDYHVTFHPEWSAPGAYVVYICIHKTGCSLRLVFKTARAFAAWIGEEESTLTREVVNA